jgi:superfamily II DNA/RNA helicase
MNNKSPSNRDSTTRIATSSSTTTPAQYQANPVFDPWEDISTIDNTFSNPRMTNNDDNDVDTIPKSTIQTGTTTAMDMRDTKSLLSSSTTINKSIQNKVDTTIVSPLSAFGRRNIPITTTTTMSSTIENSKQQQQQQQQVTKKKIDLSHLITKVPAGGRGTNIVPVIQQPPQMSVSTMSQSDRTKVSSTINDNDDNDDDGNTVVVTSNTSRSSSSKPIYDSNGIPMLLTIEQAQRLFDEELMIQNHNNSIIAMDNYTDDDNDDGITTTEITWNDVGIVHPILLENLHKMNCHVPLPAQCTSCQSILNHTTDVIVGTYTGSGKTLAVLVPIIQRLLSSIEEEGVSNNSSKIKSTSNSGYVQLIIVAPGRELASQIASVTRNVLQNNIPLSCMLAIGGTTFTRNVEQIRRKKPNILIGTPGRLAELIVGTGSGEHNNQRGGRISIHNVQTIVLDEFDALLSYTPHADPVNALIQYLKRKRKNEIQTIMCSATASDMIHPINTNMFVQEKYLRPGYVFVEADKDDVLVTAEHINDNHQANIHNDTSKTTIRVSRTVMHGVIHVPHKRYVLETIRRILHTEPLPQQILIFVSDSHKVNIMVDKLFNYGIVAAALHGGMDSIKMDRVEVSRALRDGYVGIVVATEMAARGLDAPLLTHVINLDLPTDSSHYAHRAGRCGRGGRPGVVINLTTCPQERNVPMKLAYQLGIRMHTVEVKNGKLNVIDPATQIIDGR